MEIIDKTIKSKYQPKQTNVTWIDLSGEKPVEKHFVNGRWVAVSGESGSSIVINPDEEATETLYKIKADGTVYNADISGKADKEVTPTIITPSIDGSVANLTTEELESLRIGDIVKATTESNGTTRDWFVVRVKTTSPQQVAMIWANENGITTRIWTKNNGVWSGENGASIGYTDVARKVFVEDTQPQNGMSTNTLYNLGVISQNTIFTINPAQVVGIANVWMWTFSTGSTAPTITWPAQITIWSNGEAPEIEANKYYEVSVINGVGTVISADIPQEETEVEP